MLTLDKKRKRGVKDVGMRKSPDIFDFIAEEVNVLKTLPGLRDSDDHDDDGDEDDNDDDDDASEQWGEITEEDSDSDPDSDANTDEDNSESEGEDEDMSEPRLEEGSSSVAHAATQKYHEGQESYPEWPAYDADIQDIRNGCSQVCASTSKMLSTLNCSEDQTHEHFIRKAEKSTTQDEPERVVVALMGETGAGKSETMNSILDCPGLAKTAAAGKACTAAVTEYMDAPPEQPERFAAMVYYFDRGDRKKILCEQIEDVYHYLSVKATKGKPAKDPDAEKVWKPRFDTAIKMLRALFCCRKEFQSRPDTIRHMIKRKSKSSGAMLNEAMRWLDAILESRRPGSSCDDGGLFESYDCKSVAALHKILDPLITSTTRRSSPSLWPIVNRVSIAYKGSRVLGSTVVVDLPGVADVNKVRVRAAEDYLAHCDYILLVGKIERVCDSATNASLLQRYGDQFRGKIAMVVTRSDLESGAVPGVAKDLSGLGHSTKEYRSLQKDVKAISSQLSLVDRQLSQIPVGREADVLGVAAALNDQKLALTQTKKVKESKSFHSIVRLRNRVISHELRKGKQKYCHEGDKMQVFCISNTHYAATKGRLKIDGIILHPDATGIPALRKYLLTLDALSMMAAFNRYVDSGVATLTQGLMIWAAARQVEDVDQIRRLALQPRLRYLNCVDDEMAKITEVARAKISDPLHNVKIQAQYCKAALEVIAPWKTSLWHWCTIKSFVRHSGFPTPKSVKADHNWNMELSQVAVERSIIPSWEVVKFECKTLFVRLSGSLFSRMRDVVARLDDEPEAQDLPLHTFEGFVELRIKDLDHAIVKCRADFAKQHSEILALATKDKLDNYFVRAMQPVYAACELETGRGVKGRIIDNILRYVLQKGSSSPFAMFGSAMEAAIAANSLRCASNIKQEVERVVSSIEQSLENMVLSRAQQNIDLDARAKVKTFLERNRILEKVAALQAKRDALLAKPQYAHLPMKSKDSLDW